MSKKLIAVAAAFALGATALVAVPASAAELDVYTYDYYDNIGSGSNDGLSKADALEVQVPETNELDKDYTAAELTVTATEDDQKVDFVAAGGVKIVVQKDFDDADDAGEDYPAISAGRSSYSKTIEYSGEDVSVWAFNTSTTAGTVTISSGGNTTVYYVKGIVGSAYNVAATFPTSIPTAGDGAVVKIVVTDVFGNVVNDDNDTDETYSGYDNQVDDDIVDVTVVGAYFYDDYTEDSDWSYSSKKKVWESDEILADNSGPVAIRVDLNTGVDLSDYGFAAPKAVAFSSVSALDLADQVKALTAQVAALTAQVAARVSKKRFNKLARKWNAAFPAQKVALKK